LPSQAISRVNRPEGGAIRPVGAFVAGVLLSVVFSSNLEAATAQRTFVASNGNDANACSTVAPCRGFAAAVARTNDGGEVIVLDSAGCGPVTISRSVSIVSPPGIYAGISVFTVNGIDVDGANIVVVVRGITIVGQGSGAYGINFAQGARLLIEDCEIGNMNNGIQATATNGQLVVKRTVLRGNSYGFYAEGSVVASLDGVHAVLNTLTGIVVNTGAAVTISNSVLANNRDEGLVVSAFGSGNLTDALITRSTISGSPKGVDIDGHFAGNIARLVVDSTTINDAATAAFYFEFAAGGSSTIYSPGNNTVGFNNGIVTGGALTPLGQH